MRLLTTFLLILCASIILSFLVSWGTTFAFSTVTVMAMANEFSDIAQGTVADVTHLVRDLMDDTSGMMWASLQSEYNASESRIAQSEQQARSFASHALSSVRSLTDQLQLGLLTMVTSFGGFMDDVIAAFSQVATDYAADLRLQIAMQVEENILVLVSRRVAAVQQFGKLYAVMGITVEPSPMITASTCQFLDILCILSEDLGNDFNADSGLLFGTADGCQFTCTPGLKARVIKPYQGHECSSLADVWYENTSFAPAQNLTWRQRCLTTPPDAIFPMLGHCNTSDLCDPGRSFDPRCRPWYLSHSLTPGSAQLQLTGPYIDFNTENYVLTISFPAYADYNAPRDLLGVAAVDLHLHHITEYLLSLAVHQGTLVAVIMNDTKLNVFGSTLDTANCSERQLVGPIASACDSSLQALGEWLSLQQTTMLSHVLVEIGDIVWDIFPCAAQGFAYFVAVGMNRAAIYGVIEDAHNTATSRLQNVSTEQRRQVETMESNINTELTALDSSNMEELATMRSLLERQLEEQWASAQASFNESQQRNNQSMLQMANAQQQRVQEMQEAHLRLLLDNLAWTLLVLGLVFISLLVLAVYMTVSVTRNLLHIIKVIEDVAAMRVDNLLASPMSSVTEVRRLQVACSVMVERLAHFKSFMPAGLFQPTEESENTNSPPVDDPTVISDPQRHGTITDDTLMNQPDEALETPENAPSRTLTKLHKRHVAVMVVNLLRFKAVQAKRDESYLSPLLDKYISVVHAVASEAQGHVDLVIGDQIVVTFNAHFLCLDPCEAAAGVALDLHSNLTAELRRHAATQIGISGGVAVAGAVGYAPFKTMVTTGTPVKMASLLAHLSYDSDGVVLVDPPVYNAVRCTFNLRPVLLVYLPVLGTLQPAFARNLCVYQLESLKQMNLDGTLSHDSTDADSSWSACFIKVSQAGTLDDARSALASFFLQYPDSRVAQRLRDLLSHWVPRCGVPLCEGADHLPEFHASSSNLSFHLNVP